ncbi:MAG TPA: hypothetical protein VF483_05585, partial [Gemmatimonadaceae bacterium]
EPNVVSWMAVKGSDDFRRLVDYDLTWRDDARRFEFITIPFQDFAAMNASLEMFFELGPANAARHVAALADEIVKLNQGRSGVEIVTPLDSAHRAGIVSLRPRDGRKTSEALKAAGIVHSLREGAVRLSPHVYNTSDEIRKALDVFWGVA